MALGKRSLDFGSFQVPLFLFKRPIQNDRRRAANLMDKAKLPPESPQSPASLQPHAVTCSTAPATLPRQSTSSPAPSPTAGAAVQPAAIPAQTGDTPFQHRVYQPEEIACRHQNEDLTNCGAEPGEACTWQQSGEQGTCHAERIEDAAAISQRDGTAPTEEQFDQAAWDSGLF